MPGGSVHGREPESLEEILDRLAYAQAVDRSTTQIIMVTS